MRRLIVASYNTALGRPSARRRREQGWIRSDRRWQCDRARRGTGQRRPFFAAVARTDYRG
jgi:hypothetical protein